MKKYIDKLINKIREITHSSEEDAIKILAGLMILGIAISWFIIGSLSLKNSSKHKDYRLDPTDPTKTIPK